MSRRLPARVYWFRRALVLVVIVGAVLGVRAAFPGGGEPSAADDDITAAEPSTQVSSPTSPPASERSPNQKRKKRAEQSRLPELRTVTAEFGTAAGRCTPEQTRVRPEVVGEPYSGSGVAIQLRLSTTAASSCTLRLTAEEMLVQIADSDRVLWSSEDCPDAVPDVTVVLHPYWTASVSLPWSGTRSNRGCDSDAVLDPGTYTVQAAVLGGQPAEGSLDVIAAPDPTPPTDDPPSATDDPSASAVDPSETSEDE